VKCGEDHLTEKCSKDFLPAKCALFYGAHTVSYKGFIVYKKPEKIHK
jgi:hypothetical protein